MTGQLICPPIQFVIGELFIPADYSYLGGRSLDLLFESVMDADVFGDCGRGVIPFHQQPAAYLLAH